MTVAKTVSDPLSWHRFDQSVAEWLFDGRPLVASPPAQAATPVRQIRALKQALAGVSPGIRAAWLMNRWLDLSLRVRPLASPYFAPADPLPSGGHASAEATPSPGLAARDLAQGEELVFTGGAAEVVRLELNNRASSRTRISVFEGEQLSRVLALSGRAIEGSPSRPQTVRAVVPVVGGVVRVRVLEGSATVGFAGFVKRNTVLDLRSGRLSRSHGLSRLQELVGAERAPQWLHLLTQSSRLRTARSCALLSGASAQSLAAQAVLAFESTQCQSSPDSAVQAVQALLRRLDALPSSARSSLERASLEHLLDLGVTRTHLGAASSPADPLGDEAAVAALSAALSSDPDPRASERADQAAASLVDGGELAQLARRVWLNSTSWAPLPPGRPVHTTLVAEVPEPDAASAGLCSVQAGAGLRWTVLEAQRPTLVVSESGGSHSHVLLRPLPGDRREISLKIGDLPITVHGISGLFGHIALAAGEHKISMPAGEVLLARAPRAGAVPCSELRELTRWATVERGLAFEVAPEVMNRPWRFLIRPEGLAGRGHQVSIVTGQHHYLAWVRPPASGAIELPRASSGSIEVQSEYALQVRASVRQPLRAAPVPPRSASLLGAAPETEGRLLEELREASRKLTHTTLDTERAALRLERARLLLELGAARLAEIERLGAGASSNTNDDQELEPSLALHLPKRTPRAWALGVASQIPPLAEASDASTLERARDLHEAGEPAAAVVQALSVAAANGAGADALLLANSAERAGLARVAADAYERIGTAALSGVALARAATLLADASAELSDPQLAFRGYRLARRADEYGSAALDALGRLGPTIRWLGASSAGTNNGSISLWHSGTSGSESVGLRIRRALLDAGPEALLLSDGRRLVLQSDRPEPVELTLDLTCLQLEQTGSCQASLEVDGRPLKCPGLADGLTALNTRCPVSLPPGKHRVELGTQPGEGAVVAARVATAQGLLPARVFSSWIDVQAAHPLDLRVLGPTVLRITGRARAGQAERVGVELRTPTTAQRRVWDLPPSADPALLRSGSTPSNAPEFGVESEQVWVIDQPGEQHLIVAPTHGPVLLRVHAAYGSGVPRARTVPAPPAAQASASIPYTEPVSSKPPVGLDPAPGPLTLNATASLERTDLSELEGGRADIYQQLRVAALRELGSSLGHVSAGLVYRLREGADSWGAVLLGSSPPRGFFPGPFARLSFMQQSLSSGVATGWYGNLGLLWRVPLSPNSALVPWTEVTGRQAGSVGNTSSAVDRDVYTSYSALHPLSLSSGLRVSARPLLDMLASYGISTRYSPRNGAFDRVDATLSVDALAGSGLFPWLSAWSTVSHRPISSIRDQAFTRTTFGGQVSFFGWLRGSERWVVFGRVVGFVDWPAGTRTFSFALGVSADETFYRGLRDYPPSAVPFRGRLEEGSARVHRRGPARDPDSEVGL